MATPRIPRTDMVVRADILQQLDEKSQKFVYLPVLYVDGDLTAIADAKAVPSRTLALKAAEASAKKLKSAAEAHERAKAVRKALRKGKFASEDPTRGRYLIKGKPVPTPPDVFDLTEVATLIDGARCLSRDYQTKVGVVLASDRGAADMLRVALVAGCPWVTATWEYTHEDNDMEALVVRAGALRILTLWYDKGSWLVRNANDTTGMTMFSARGALSVMVQWCTTRKAFGAARAAAIEADSKTPGFSYPSIPTITAKAKG